MTKTFYKIENGKAQVGSGIFVLPEFIEYKVGEEPNELLEALEIERLEIELVNKTLEAERVRKKAMLDGDIYDINGTGYNISFTKNDGDGLMQVKSAFEMGLSSTILYFDNGTKMPVNALEFIQFAQWFVNKRNEFFA